MIGLPEPERTFCFLKPDGQKLSVMCFLLERATKKGLRFDELEQVVVTRGILEMHYEEYVEADFFGDMCDYLMENVTVPAMIFHGEDAVAKIREIIGATRPWEAADGTLRHIWGSMDREASPIRNAAHASDSPENAEREIALWLPAHI